MRWLGEEPLAGRPTLEKLRIRAGVALGVLFLAGPISDLGDESLEPSKQVALGIGGDGWSATGWAVMTAWTVAFTVLAVQVYRRDTGKR